MIQSAPRGGRSDLSKMRGIDPKTPRKEALGFRMKKHEISPVKQIWGQFGVMGGPRAHVEAIGVFGWKSLLIPTLNERGKRNNEVALNERGKGKIFAQGWLSLTQDLVEVLGVF